MHDFVVDLSAVAVCGALGCGFEALAAAKKMPE
jgi:hypothetical protein